MPDKLLPVKADTVQDFMDNAHKAIGDDTKIGDTSSKLSLKFDTDSKTKMIKSATFSLTTSITRAHWVGAAKVKPDKENEAAIKKIESLNKAHEEAHRKGYEAAFKKNKEALEKELVGMKPDDADQVVKKMQAALTKACEDLHKKGGMIDFVDNGKGKITVAESAEGPGGCD